MDQFQNTNSGSGILKNYYDTIPPKDSPLAVALKKKREKLTDERFGEQGNPEDKELDDIK